MMDTPIAALVTGLVIALLASTWVWAFIRAAKSLLTRDYPREMTTLGRRLTLRRWMPNAALAGAAASLVAGSLSLALLLRTVEG